MERNLIPSVMLERFHFLYAPNDAGVDQARSNIDVVVSRNVTFSNMPVKTAAALKHFAGKCKDGDIMAMVDDDITLHLVQISH